MDAPSKEADVHQTVVMQREPQQLEPYRITGTLRVRNELSVSPSRISKTVHPGEPLSVEFTVENWTSQPWSGIEISGIDREKFTSEFRFNLGTSKLPAGGPLQSFDCSLELTSPGSSPNALLKVIPTPMIDGKAVSLTHIGNLEIMLHQESPGRAIPPVLVARRATIGRHAGSVKIVLSDALANVEDLVLSATVENAVETESKIERIDAKSIRIAVTGAPSGSDARALWRVHARGELIAEVPIAFVD